MMDDVLPCLDDMITFNPVHLAMLDLKPSPEKLTNTSTTESMHFFTAMPFKVSGEENHDHEFPSSLPTSAKTA
jgi:hypothetical protein